jgi:hypothetical protein
VGHELRNGLGDWLRRRYDHGVCGQGRKARETLEDCGVPLPELRRQWDLQREAQMSIRAREYSEPLTMLNYIERFQTHPFVLKRNSILC